MKKDNEPDDFAFINNYNFYDRQTDRHSYGHGDSMTYPAQRAESVKIVVSLILKELFIV